MQHLPAHHTSSPEARPEPATAPVTAFLGDALDLASRRNADFRQSQRPARLRQLRRHDHFWMRLFHLVVTVGLSLLLGSSLPDVLTSPRSAFLRDDPNRPWPWIAAFFGGLYGILFVLVAVNVVIDGIGQRFRRRLVAQLGDDPALALRELRQD